ncbi:disulfide oxidoreductase [Paenibacillus herberti]|uniref:Disulfide bond formation protein B n=1 Tax=Paenibacillus herberti TaxID=1619309 RepID=A0A229P3G0_9BACL|nr:disulfide oxidoreductase [Paenibacillus herberti]OXM16783.1 disulfide bond formation protein B [Paenibacillus herberti]
MDNWTQQAVSDEDEYEDEVEYLGFWERYRFYFAWIIALTATLGSLYLSEIKGFIPCDLCWYQRIFMYPLAIILGVAVYKGDRSITRYVIPLAWIGIAIALYHNMLIWFPDLAGIVPCKSGVPCNRDYLNWFGFITIPLLSMTAFTMILACLHIKGRR